MGVVWGELEHGVRGLIMKEEIDKRVNKTTFASNPYMNLNLHIPSSVRFLAPKLHTSALTAILYTFMTQTTPTQ